MPKEQETITGLAARLEQAEKRIENLEARRRPAGKPRPIAPSEQRAIDTYLRHGPNMAACARKLCIKPQSFRINLAGTAAKMGIEDFKGFLELRRLLSPRPKMQRLPANLHDDRSTDSLCEDSAD